MKWWQFITSKVDPIYVLFAGLGFTAIAIFIGVKTAFFVLSFLATMALWTYFLTSIFSLIFNKGKLLLVTQLMPLALLAITSSIILYVIFGSHALLKSMSMGFVIVMVVAGYTWIAKR